ncbi:MAG: hypothetical protein IT258_07020 [Saprospiraceae bacterium]|nr:hypothetical protein [Saprospiraceae bacterium]
MNFKITTKFLVGIIAMICFLPNHTWCMGKGLDSISLQEYILQFEKETEAISSSSKVKIMQCRAALGKVEHDLENILLPQDIEFAVELLLEKNKLQKELEFVANDAQIKLAKLRFRKGVELTRLLYEKILGLDHHFSTMQTVNDIVKMSNPNNYAEFSKIRDVIISKIEKQSNVNIPGLLEDNLQTSSSFILMSSIYLDDSNERKEERLASIACILDFTLRMNSDLNLIFYESDYLKQSNIALKKECIDLFYEYSKVVGYNVPLDKCREQDDWETLYSKLDDYIAEVKTLYAGSEAEKDKAYKKHASLEFPVNLLTEFIHKYNNFIGQGERYYQKFELILSNYGNEAVCAKELPEKFQTLKTDIKTSIAKFNEAYNIAELRGSKLKDLLYGWEND